MALTEIFGASILFIGHPVAEETHVIQPAEVIAEANELAVLPKVLKIMDAEIYWVEQ